MGFAPRIPFSEGLEDTVRWYKQNRHWWEPLKRSHHGTRRRWPPGHPGPQYPRSTRANRCWLARADSTPGRKRRMSKPADAGSPLRAEIRRPCGSVDGAHSRLTPQTGRRPDQEETPRRHHLTTGNMACCCSLWPPQPSGRSCSTWLVDRIA
jgi:hypothetical protein